MIDSELLLKAVHAVNEGILITDARQADNPIIFANPAFERITGYTMNEIIGQNCRFLQASDKDQAERKLVRNAIEKGRSCRVKLRNYRKDGQLFWNELSISPVCDEAGVVTHFIGVQKDFTAQQRLEDKLYAKSMEDPLTGLFNRRGFFMLAEKRIKLAKRHGVTEFSFILLDIDDLKIINDSYGHMSGDRAIILVAKMLDELSRKSDIVSRFGGDEFLILLQGDTSPAEGYLLRLLEKIKLLNERQILPFEVNISIGSVDFKPDDTRNLDELIHEADVLMYQNKNNKIT